MESFASTALTEQTAEIAAHVRVASGGRKEEFSDRLLTTREAVHLLNVSYRTLRCMCSEQYITCVILCSKCHYRQPEVGRPLEDSIVTGDAATPEQMERNHTLRMSGKPKGRRTQDMELLARSNFENWMQKMMERFDRQDEMLLSMQLSNKIPNPIDGVRLFDNQDPYMLLQISKRTLQRYRSIDALPYKTLGKRTYYSEAGVLTFLSKRVEDFHKEDITFYEARTHNFFQR